MKRTGGYTQQLAEFVVITPRNQFSDRAMELGRQHMLDTFAVGIAALQTDIGQKIRKYGERSGGRAEASIIGSSLKASAETAALCNGTLCHALDYDDDCVTTITHPGAVIIPALFALAESRGASGREVVEAFVMGVETIALLNKVFGSGPYLKGWHPTATLGVVAATAACARLLGLDVVQTANALAMAGSFASGSLSNFGTMTKPLHAGQAAKNGVMATLLAQGGFSANTQMFEDPRYGYFELYRGAELASGVAFDVGHSGEFHLVDPGINFKMYPCCAGLHATLDATRHIVKTHDIQPNQVEKAETIVEQILINTLDNQDVENSNEARFSLQYGMAVMLCRHKAGIAEFLPAVVADPVIKDIIERCSVVLKNAPPCGTYPVDASVSITLKDGSLHTHAVEGYLGHSRINPFARQDLVDKAGECLAFAGIPGKRDALVSTVLDRFDNHADMVVLGNFLRGISL
jgi:2-methylcitrate dehydratase PrpD